MRVAYDDVTGCVNVDLLDGIREDWEFDFIYGKLVRTSDGFESQFELEPQSDGTFHASVPFDTFGFEPGEYTIEVTLAMKDRLTKWFYGETLEIGEDEIGSDRRAGTNPSQRDEPTVRVLRVTPVREGTTGTAELVQTEAGPRIELRVTLSDEVSYSNVMIPVWTWSNGQDDTAWYTAEHQEDGTWLIRINPEKHGSYDILGLDIYGDNGGEREIQGSILIGLS